MFSNRPHTAPENLHSQNILHVIGHLHKGPNVLKWVVNLTSPEVKLNTGCPQTHFQGYYNYITGRLNFN